MKKPPPGPSQKLLIKAISVDIFVKFSYNFSMGNINFIINKAVRALQEIGNIAVVIFKEVKKYELQG